MLILIGTLSVCVNAEDWEGDVLNWDFSEWSEMSPERQGFYILAVWTGVYAMTAEAAFWGIDLTNLLERWKITPMQVRDLVYLWYWDTRDWEFPLWIVVFAHGDEVIINEYREIFGISTNGRIERQDG